MWDKSSNSGLFGYVTGESSTNPVVIQNINLNANVNITGMSISYGKILHNGGIIEKASNVYMYKCSFNGIINSRANSAVIGGGGIIAYASNYIEINDCYNEGNINGSTASGGIVGYYSGGGTLTITNCYNTGSVNVLVDEDGYIGGIVGYAGGSNINISDCWNSGTISETSESAFAGGIVAYMCNSTISDCYNTGIVSGTQSTGGIIGEIDKNSTCAVTNCYNTGSITVYRIDSFTGNAVGGVVGYSISTSSEIRYCYNEGDVLNHDSSWAGGIISVSYGTIRDCYNLGDVETEFGGIGGICGANDGTVANCYNAGTITENDFGGYFYEIPGGVVGNNTENGIVRNCFNLGNLYCDTSVGGIIGYNENSSSSVSYCYWSNSSLKGCARNSISSTCEVASTSDMKDINWFLDSSNWYSSYPWNFDETWAIISGVNNGFPILMENRNIYIITYNPNGGSGTMDASTKTSGADLTLSSNTFIRIGYVFQGWAILPTGSVVYVDGATYSADADITLYAVWSPMIIPISLNWNSGNGGTNMIYLKYDSGWYSNSIATDPITSITAPTRTGFAFNGYNTNSSGTGTTLINSLGTITASDTYYSTDGTKTIYAQWVARNPAKYDSEGGYWYIENGKMPQKKVTDSALVSNINSSTTVGTTYYFAGLSLQSNVYGGKEYCQYNGNWYEVMPIKWRLVYSSNQTTGYGTETETLAVMAEIVYIDAFSDSYLGVDMGYSSESITEFKKNQIDGTYLLSETKSMLTFGSTSINGTPTSITENIFVASSEDISNFTTNANGTEKQGSIKFSDLAKDFLLSNGKDTLYFTRDLGDNYNHLNCMNANGDKVQYKAQNYLGMQLSIVVTEYACM